MTAAVLVAVLVFIMPWVIVAAYVEGVRYERRRRGRRHDVEVEQALRLLEEP